MSARPLGVVEEQFITSFRIIIIILFFFKVFFF